MTSPRTIARSYCERGWAPVPVGYRDKGIYMDGWQQLRVTTETVAAHFGTGRGNVGVLLGEPSGGLVDVDLDDEIVRALAPEFLPATAAIFGRATNRASHWLYISPGARTKSFEDPTAAKGDATLVELRSTGAQTVFPGSTHKDTGEPIAWDAGGEPTPIEAEKLRRAIGRLATAALLTRYWPAEGARHHAALALAGTLLRGGWSEEEATDFLRIVAKAADDPEVADRVNAVATTARRLASGQDAWGLPKLAELLGDRAAKSVREWLDVGHEERLPCTDLGNARRLAVANRDRLRFTRELGWLVYTGQRWERTEEAPIRAAKEVARALHLEAAAAKDERDRATLGKWALASQSAARILGMVKLAASEPELSARLEDFDRDPWLFNVENGTLNLRTGLLQPHQSSDFLTLLAPVRFDPAAECPLWEGTYLPRVLPDPAVRAHVQRALGYSLTGLTSEQCFWVWFGGGANGKSTGVELCLSVWGDYAASLHLATLTTQQRGLGASEDLARLRGKRLVAAIETGDRQRLHEPLIKQLTGGDTVNARYLYQNSFDYRPAFKILLATNFKPVIEESTEAMWRRVRLVPWTATIPPTEQIKDLPDRLSTERSGILNWLLVGLTGWRDAGGLGVPEAVSRATAAYRAESDTVGTFVRERCDVGEDFRVEAGELFEGYREWCEGADREAESLAAFGKRLTGLGFGKRRRGTGTDGTRPYLRVGLRLRPQTM